MSGMEIVGLVAGVIPLATMAKDLYDSIQRLRLNRQRAERLTKLVDNLVEILGTARDSPSPAQEHVRCAVQEVKSILDSLIPKDTKMVRVCKIISRAITAPGKADKLDEVERKLESLTTQVVVVKGIIQLEEELPRVCNEKMELPECMVGLERAKNALDFLQRSAGEELRVVGIHGLPGLGKSTLLNFIWNEASSTAPFAARAHIQLGQSVNDLQICALQSIILQQLGGERNVQFTASDGGKEKLSEHLQQLKRNKKPIFLAIDNVFEVEDLSKLLPEKLSKCIPNSSVIALTCRSRKVVNTLLSICHLHQDNGSQVYLLNPDFLKSAESKAVFAACGDLSDDADAELLKSLVPLCGGLPLALSVLGKLFAGNARRSREEWELIKEQMEKLDGGDTETRPVTKALQVSYDQLHESRKVAFCEVVKCFYGWNWERVKRILSVTVLTDLKESSLISEADHWSKCNQRALREGFDLDDQDRWNHRWHYLDELRVVTMHDLTLTFGEGLRTELSVKTTTDSRSMRGRLQLSEAPKLRNLIMWKPSDEGDLELDQFLEKAASLRTLFLRDRPGDQRCTLKTSFYPNSLCTEEQPLRFLRLEGWKSSKIIMEIKLSSELRELHLSHCREVEQLPAELGRLKNLSDLWIQNCPRLQTLPTMSCPLQRLHLVELPIANLDLEETTCARLQKLILYRCRNMDLRSCCNLKASFSLRELVLIECDSLVGLPDEVGGLAALTRLDLWKCSNLKALSPAIGKASSLPKLDLGWCSSLVELPDEVGKLAALTRLDLTCCSNLKALPPAIGTASSLRELRLANCTSLVQLPDEVGELTALTELVLEFCESLKALPPGIGNASSLRELNLWSCTSLVELPDEVGELTALTRLDLRFCSSLKALPPAIGNASSLQELNLCATSLVELPDEVGKLAALTRLHLGCCHSLKTLPAAIGMSSSLRDLILWDCVDLVELPPLRRRAILSRCDSCCSDEEELPGEDEQLAALSPLRISW